MSQPSEVLRTRCALLLLLANVYCRQEDLCPNVFSRPGTGPAGGFNYLPSHSLSSDPGPPLWLALSSKPIISFLESSSTCFPCLVWTSGPDWMMFLRAGPIHLCGPQCQAQCLVQFSFSWNLIHMHTGNETLWFYKTKLLHDFLGLISLKWWSS